MTPTRTETLVFKAALDKERVERHTPDLRTIGFGSGIEWIHDGDTFRADYRVNIAYIGKVVENLEAFARIISDPDVVVDMTADELNHGRSVIFDLVQQVTRVQDIIKARQFGVQLTEKTTEALKAQDACPLSWWPRIRDLWSR